MNKYRVVCGDLDCVVLAHHIYHAITEALLMATDDDDLSDTFTITSIDEGYQVWDVSLKAVNHVK